MTKFITILMVICQLGLAEESVHLNKGQEAPFDGFLITAEKVQEIRQIKIERDVNLKLNESYDKSLKLQEDMSAKKDNQINLLLDQNDKLAKSAYASQSVNDFTKILLFLGGAVVTGFIAYGVHQTTR